MTHHPSADVCSPHPSADVCSPRTAPEGSAAAVGEAHGTQRTVQGAAAAKPQRGPDTKHAKHTKGAVTQDAARKHDAGREPAAARRPSPQPPAPPVRIGSPDALLAVVPALLGFEPGNSMVVIGVESPRAQVRLTLRYDLPDPPDAELSAAVARHAVSVLAAQHIDSAAAVGYGAEHLVSPVAAALRERAPLAGIAVMELLRAEGQRYWSYSCSRRSRGRFPLLGRGGDVRLRESCLDRAQRAALGRGHQVRVDPQRHRRVVVAEVLR